MRQGATADDVQLKRPCRADHARHLSTAADQSQFNQLRYGSTLSKIVDGASLQPLSGGRPEQIVLLLHGYGSSGSDLISLAPHWQPALPNALFLAPHAPQPCRMGRGRQWWPLDAFSPKALAQGAASTAPVIDAFIDGKLSQYGLSEADLAIVGFSQGTMMALHVGLRREHQLAGVVGYSGMLTGAEVLSREIQSKPPVLLVHGSADPIVPVSATREAKAELEHLGVPVIAHTLHGLGHTVDPVGLRLGCKFVLNSFSHPVTARA